MTTEVKPVAPGEVATSLDQLVGARIMRCVPKLDIRHPTDPDASGCMFDLDGVVYLVFEDPNDGYRSAAGPLLGFKGDTYQLCGDGVSPEYLPHARGTAGLAVVCTLGDGSEYPCEGETGVLMVRHADTGFLLFEIGTHNESDYYPCYRAWWNAPQ